MKKSRDSLAAKIRRADFSEWRFIAKYGRHVPSEVKRIEWRQEGYKRDPLGTIADGWKEDFIVRQFWTAYLLLDADYFREIAKCIDTFKNQKQSADPQRQPLGDNRFFLYSKKLTVEQIKKLTGWRWGKQRLRVLLNELNVPHKKSKGGAPRKPVVNKRLR